MNSTAGVNVFRQKLLQIFGIRKGLGERMIFELKEGKEKVRKETEERERTKTKALRWKRTWFVLGPVGRLICLKPRKAWEPKQIGPVGQDVQLGFTLTVMRTHEGF